MVTTYHSLRTVSRGGPLVTSAERCTPPSWALAALSDVAATDQSHLSMRKHVAAAAALRTGSCTAIFNDPPLWTGLSAPGVASTDPGLRAGDSPT